MTFHMFWNKKSLIYWMLLNWNGGIPHNNNKKDKTKHMQLKYIFIDAKKKKRNKIKRNKKCQKISSWNIVICWNIFNSI